MIKPTKKQQITELKAEKKAIEELVCTNPNCPFAAEQGENLNRLAEVEEGLITKGEKITSFFDNFKEKGG